MGANSGSDPPHSPEIPPTGGNSGPWAPHGPKIPPAGGNLRQPPVGNGAVHNAQERETRHRSGNDEAEAVE